MSVQKRLKKMNYSPGIIDGCWGSGISGALSGFLNDRPLTMAAPTSLEMFMEALPELEAELSEAEAEGFIRPVSEKRNSGDLKTVAAVAPEVVPTRRNFLAATWASVAAFFSAIWTSISDYMSQAWSSSRITKTACRPIRASWKQRRAISPACRSRYGSRSPAAALRSSHTTHSAA